MYSFAQRADTMVYDEPLYAHYLVNSSAKDYHPGADEALMLDIYGFVATCNATNFFMVKGSEVWTSTGQYCMNGITRAKVVEVCKNDEIPCLQKNFSLFDVYGADEAFVTGTFGGLTPVTAVDGRTIGEGAFGPMTRRLEALYQDEIKTAVLAAQKAS